MASFTIRDIPEELLDRFKDLARKDQRSINSEAIDVIEKAVETRVQPLADIDDQFTELTREWKRETLISSSATEMALNPHYQRIIGLGNRVIPLILKELERELDHWFWALTAITGENPIPAEHAGDLERMRDDWLEYGRKNRARALVWWRRYMVWRDMAKRPADWETYFENSGNATSQLNRCQYPMNA